MDIGTCDLNLRSGVSFSIIRVFHLPHKPRPFLAAHRLDGFPIARYLVRLDSLACLLISDTREGFVIVCLRHLVRCVSSIVTVEIDRGDKKPTEIDSSVRGHGRRVVTPFMFEAVDRASYDVLFFDRSLISERSMKGIIVQVWLLA